MNDLSKSELEELEKMITSLINAPTKAVGKDLRKRLDFKASSYYDRLTPNMRTKLKEAISLAGDASGQDSQKAHWEQHSKQSWHVFKSYMNSSGANNE